MKNKVVLAPGLRFNAPQTAKSLIGSEFDFQVYSSSPPSKWGEGIAEKTTFVPLVSKIVTHILPLKRTRKFKEFDSISYDFLLSRLYSSTPIFHGWATFSLFSARRQKRDGGRFILDRACPHMLEQQSILAAEADVLGMTYEPVSDSFLDRILEEYTLADTIVVPSEYTKTSFIKHGIEAEKLYKAPLDANLSIRGFQRNKRNGDDFILGSVGGNLLRKGYYYLLHAWKNLALKNARLLIKTSSEELKQTKALKDLLGSCDNVEIVDYVENIEDFYSRCDAFCLPSVDEGFGMVVPEALASGLPVIVSENVGAAELVEESLNGFVVPIRDTVALQEKILFLYEDSDRLGELSANALKIRGEADCTETTYSDRILRLYRSI